MSSELADRKRETLQEDLPVGPKEPVHDPETTPWTRTQVQHETTLPKLLKHCLHYLYSYNSLYKVSFNS